DGEEEFLANYSDGISDLPLDQLIADFRAKRVVASFASVNSSQTFHTVSADDEGYVQTMKALHASPLRINGGFFALRHDIFDYVNEGDELVEAPFQRLVAKRLLATYRYDGFWHAMDTFKDKITLDRMEAKGDCPWMVWRR